MGKPLREVVPFVKGQQYYEKFRPMTPDTFGCDIEFHAEKQSADAYDYKDDIISGMTSGAWWRKNQDDYYEWLENERQSLNKRYSWRGEWDDQYGPIDVDTWLEHNAEPERVTYGDRETAQEEFDDAHRKWEDDKSDVEYNYRKWTIRDRDDYNETWASEMISNDSWENYTDFRVPEDTDAVVERDIAETAQFIRYDLHQSVTAGSNSTAVVWAVGEDASGVVEIRTRHMKDTSEDYDLIKEVLSYVSNKETGGDTSAHVHIGLPKDFQAFDILAMADLVDEKSVQMDVGQDRDWRQFSQLAYELHGYIIKVLTTYFDVPKHHLETYTKHHPGWTVSNETMLKILNRINRHMGTNLVAYFVHGTVEFRYFSSEAASRNPDKFIRWIKYFMTIPKIAKRRNSIVIGKGRVGGMRFERKSNGDVFIKFEKSDVSNKLSMAQHSEFEKLI